MAYVSKEKKASLTAGIKQVLVAYGMKGTISVRHGSTLVVKLSSGSIDFNKCKRPSVDAGWSGWDNADVHKDFRVNVYWISSSFTGVAAEFLEKLVLAMKGEEWYDNSDIQTDYFNTAHYFDVVIGPNKEYVVK